MREKAPLTRVRLWDGSTPWLVTRHAEQRALLSDPRVSADVTRPGYPSMGPVTGTGLSFILMDDPEHARLRRTVTAPFTVRRMKQLRPTVQRIVDRLIDDLLAGPKPVDLVEAFALPVPSLVICELLGVPYADHEFFQENSRTRDPLVFPGPDRLDLRRDGRRHLAFGFGVHQCLGQPLARMELQVVYGTLYRRIPTLRPAVDPRRLPFKHDAFVFGVHELPVTW